MKPIYTQTLLLIICHLLFIAMATAQPGALDLTFDPGTGANDWVTTTAVQPNGKILAGGKFTTFRGSAAPHITRLNADGSLDTTFHPGAGANLNVTAIVLQPDGKILVAGLFDTFHTTPAKRIVRLQPDGSVDTSFHTADGFNHYVHCMALQADGKIVVGGEFTGYGGTACSRLARLNTNGTYDLSFNTASGPNGTVQSLAIQPDNKILIGGSFTMYGISFCLRVARVQSNGSFDSSYNTAAGASSGVYDIALQPNNMAILGGEFVQYQLQPRNHIIRLQSDGNIDASFYMNQGANAEVEAIHIYPDSNILVGGGFTQYDGAFAPRLARLNHSAKLDTTFNPGQPGADDKIFAISIPSGNKIIIGGAFINYNGTARHGLARLYNCLTPQPDSIYGLNYAPCNGTPQTYSTTPVSGATKYEWTLPTGWLGSSDSASIVATSNGIGGTIAVKAFTDSCGWSNATTRTITTISPPSVNICLVTVDTLSTHNIIIWEKPLTPLIDSFFIYRETTTNVYTKIAAVAYDSLSEYHDTAANPNITSYRYKLSVLDTCGAESALSPYHSTIHFQNLGGGNFQWTFYQIEGQLNPVNSFNIYRDNLGNGNFSQIGNVPGTNATFFDNTFNSFSNSEYVTDVNWGIGCTPSRQVNTTRSNKRPKNAIDVLSQHQPEAQHQIQLYPNPAHETITVRYPENFPAKQIQIRNMLGQTLAAVTPPAGQAGSGWNTVVIPTTQLARGVYTVSIETDIQQVIKKILVQ